MPKRPRFGIEVERSKGPNFGARPLPAAGGVWVLHILLLVPGVFVSLLALSVYPLLDPRRMMGFLLGFFLLPVVLQMLTILRKSPGNDVRWGRAAYIGSGLALPLLGLLLFLNGGLDRSHGNTVRPTVVRKTVIGGRATRYHLWVSSWRPGRILEDFNVGSREFDRAVVGKPVTVELHNGFFGLSWRGTISTQ